MTQSISTNNIRRRSNSFVLTIGTKDQEATESAYVTCAHACVTSENQALDASGGSYLVLQSIHQFPSHIPWQNAAVSNQQESNMLCDTGLALQRRPHARTKDCQ